MGYIDKDLKIKTVSGIEKYLKNKFNYEFIVVKTTSQVKVIWCSNNKLLEFNLSAYVIYTIETKDFNLLINTIENSLK